MSEEQKHIVVVGGGLGGLICGYLLAKNGYRISLYEQHFVAGGCLQSFVRDEVKFDTGMHYVGSMNEGESLYRFWDFLGLRDKIRLQKLDENGFDLINFNGKIYRFGSGTENFVNILCEEFPDQRENLVKYVEKIKEVASYSILNSGVIDDRLLVDNEYLTMSVDQFLDQIIDDQRLKNVLLGNSILYAGQTGVTPAYLHALINLSFIEGAHRIVGGSDAIAAALCEGIVECGGEVVTRAKVVELVSEDKRVTRAVLSDGRVVEGDYFISNIHPAATVAMIKQGELRKSYCQRILSTTNTTSVFLLYLKFKTQSVPYQNYNNFCHQNSDSDSHLSINQNQFAESFLYMHQCEEEGMKFAKSGIVMTYMDFDDVAQWQDVRNRANDVSYREFVAKHSEILLEKLEKTFPGIRQNIETYHTSTPLTYLRYTGTPQGAIYGTALDATKVMGGTITHLTKLSNLFLVGQNTYAHGMLGVVMGAIFTCGEFLGLDRLVGQINQNKPTHKKS